MDLETEAEQLRSAWRRHSPEFLDVYLVHGVENPCFNPQSVVLRGLLIETLWPGRHLVLLQQERLYSACACTTLLAVAQGRLDPFTAALEGEPGAEKFYPLPEFLRRAREHAETLPFTLRGMWQSVFQATLGGFGGFTSPFEALWRERLGADLNEVTAGIHTPSSFAKATADRHPNPLPVEGRGDSPSAQPGLPDTLQSRANFARIKLLETACGSANDFRYWERYGLGRWVDYMGIDISAANIANARRRCPQGTFAEGDAMRLPYGDGSFDYYCVFDLFEHLSLAGMERALREAVRVTRRELWLSFFQLEWQAEHTVVPEPPYHRNILGVPKLLALLAELGCDARVIDVPADWAREFPGYRHYNPRGRIIAARMRGAG